MTREWEEIRRDLETAFSSQDVPSLLMMSEELNSIDTVAARASKQLCLGLVAFRRGLMSEALNHFVAAKELFEAVRNHLFFLSITTQMLGLVYLELGLFVEALDHFNLAKDVIREMGITNLPGGYLSSVANLYIQTGIYAKALEYYEKERSMFSKHGEHLVVARLTSCIGYVHLLAEQYDDAWSNLKQAEHYFSSVGDIDGIANTLKKFGMICSKTDRVVEALDFFTEAQKLLQSINFYGDAVSCHAAIIDLLITMNRFEEARSALAEIQIHDVESVETRVDLQLSLARIEENDGRYDEAVKTLNDLLTLVTSVNLPKKTVDVHRELRDLAAIRNDFASYIKHNDAAIKVREEISGSQVRIQMALFSKEQEIETERQQREIERERRVQAEKELALKTAHLGTQIELVAAFKKQLRSVLAEANSAEAIVRLIRERLNEFQEEQIDWAYFEKQFVELHPEFVSAMRATYPALTKQELKMCQLIRIGLKSHEIANILSLSERSIENHRFNLRKKLGLKSTDRLHEIVARIS